MDRYCRPDTAEIRGYVCPITQVDSLFDRDTIPGAEPEQLMPLKVPMVILPGHTDNHATSCARFLEECILGANYWDVHLETQPPELIRHHILAFLLDNKK